MNKLQKVLLGLKVSIALVVAFSVVMLVTGALPFFAYVLVAVALCPFVYMASKIHQVLRTERGDT